MRVATLCLLAALNLKAVEHLEEAIVIPAQSARLKGMAIVANEFSRDSIFSAESDGIYIDAQVPFLSSSEFLKMRLATLLQDQEITQSVLLTIRDEILAHYRESGQHAVHVEIPEQDITDGFVVCQVKTPKTGKVVYLGNRWLSEERVAKRVGLTSGECLDACGLLNRIGWLNQNPFHYTSVILAPSKQKGKTDVEIVTKDRFPLRLYSGGDNTGVESTGKSRFFGGATWGNAFLVDDLLTYQFTSNMRYDKFHNHLGNYVSYLPWGHIFMLYGGYAKLETTLSGFKTQGKEAQASFRYKIPFKPYYTNFQHQFYFGFDYKYVTNALFFVAELNPTGVFNTIVNVTQEMLGYFMEYNSCPHQATFQVELYGSPVEWLSHQSTQDYGSLRAHAKPHYFYGTVAVGDIYIFPNRMSVAALVRAQGATGALVPSEQFKLGGYNSVRGYEESVFISDNGVIANFELRSDHFTLLKKREDQLTLLAFVDYGWGYNYYPFDGLEKTAILWGVGPGVRYNIHPYFNFRCDYGFKLHKVKFDDNKLGMLHIGAALSY